MAGKTDDDALLRELGIAARDAVQMEREVIREALEAAAHQGGDTTGQATAHDGGNGTGPGPSDRPAAGKSKQKRSTVEAQLHAQLAAVRNEINALATSAVGLNQQRAASPAGPDALKGSGAQGGKSRVKTSDPAQSVAGDDIISILTSCSDDNGRHSRHAVVGEGRGPLGDSQDPTAAQTVAAQQQLSALRAEQKRLSRQLRQLQDDRFAGLDGPAGRAADVTTNVPARPPHAPKRPAAQAPSKSKPQKTARIEWVDDGDLFGSAEEDTGGGSSWAGSAAAHGAGPSGLVESERDMLIRRGIITPFQALQGIERRAQQSLQPTMVHAFNRQPLEEAVLGAVGRSGKPLAALIAEASFKTQATVAGRPTTQLLEDGRPRPELERDVRHIPAHFWANAVSGKRLPPSAPGVPLTGAIPNLSATRAPLPPLKQLYPGDGSRQRRRRAPDDAHRRSEATASQGAARLAEPRRAVRRRTRASLHRSAAGEESSGDRDRAGGGGRHELPVGPAARVALAGGVSERGAAKRARQRLGEIAADIAADEGESESSAFEPSDREQKAGRRSGYTLKHPTPASPGDGSSGSSPATSPLASDSGSDGRAQPAAGRNTGIGAARGHRHPRMGRASYSTAGGDSDSDSDSLEEKEEGLSGGADDDVSAREEAADDVAGRYDDADEAYFQRRQRAAAARLEREDAVAAADAARAAAAAAGGDVVGVPNHAVDGTNGPDGNSTEAAAPEARTTSPEVGAAALYTASDRRDVAPDVAAAGRRAHGLVTGEGGGPDEQPSPSPTGGGPTRRRHLGGGHAVRVSEPPPAMAAEAASDAVQGPGVGGGSGSAPQYVELAGGLRLALRVWGRLFGYQRTGVQWLWELHCREVGGILGDEMGLGKTVQIAAYLGALHDSGRWPGPCLVVCPATVMRQWLRELRVWAPRLRVVVMHDSMVAPPSSAGGSGRPRPTRARLVGLVAGGSQGGEAAVLLTSYEQLRLNRSLLTRVRWGVAVLDEGHKIRNPDAEVTLTAKQLACTHRLVVSGSPIQNRLAELWSLMDFVFPGKLGTLPVFQAQFAIPIQIGGYTNATQQQVATAYRCALVLRDLVAPHLLRRRKADVAIQLPAKTEQVLFCSLVPEQLELYRAYLASDDVRDILSRKRQALAGIDILRKITNHPDLLERLTSAASPDYGAPERSGKLNVAKRLLQHWTEGGHKVLLFCQTQQMLDIIEKMVCGMGIPYHRMDGGTSIALRARLIDDFNTNPDVALFLLTTKVGGLGVNLVGADRVLLYDPDWNPATDTQARERAWRIGQARAVTIYRLITAGTIEEKVYHRQVYKSYLTNKVLKDPRQKRLFAAKDLTDLFTLGAEYGKQPSSTARAAAAQRALAGALGGGATPVPAPATETARIFGDAGHDVELDLRDAAGDGRAQDPHLHPSAPSAVPQLQQPARVPVADTETGGEQPPKGAASGTRPPQGGVTEEQDSEGLEYGSGAPRAKSSAQPPLAARRQPSSSSNGAVARVVDLPPLPGMAQVRPSGVVVGSTGGAPAPPADAEAPGEMRLLKQLFEGAGVKSLVDHTRVETMNDPEALAAEAEARRVAARAAEALRRSREEVMRAPINAPTWTGRSGQAGAPLPAGPPARPPQKRFGSVVAGRAASGGMAQGSVAVLRQLQARHDDRLEHEDDGGGGGGGGGFAMQGIDSAEAQELAAQVVAYLDEHGGRQREVASTALVTAFRAQLPDNRLSLFRQLLNQVAVLNKRNGAGFWRLKREFWGISSGGAETREAPGQGS